VNCVCVWGGGKCDDVTCPPGGNDRTGGPPRGREAPPGERVGKLGQHPSCGKRWLGPDCRTKRNRDAALSIAAPPALTPASPALPEPLQTPSRPRPLTPPAPTSRRRSRTPLLTPRSASPLRRHRRQLRLHQQSRSRGHPHLTPAGAPGRRVRHRCSTGPDASFARVTGAAPDAFQAPSLDTARSYFSQTLPDAAPDAALSIAAPPASTPASPASTKLLQTPRPAAAFPSRHPRRVPRPRRRGSSTRDGTSPPITTLPLPRYPRVRGADFLRCEGAPPCFPPPTGGVLGRDNRVLVEPL
jgi:hypothetical protein